MKNKSENESMLLKIQEVQEQHEKNKTNMFDHFVMVFESTDEGFPTGQLIKMQATPLKALGMVSIAMNQLKQIKRRIEDSMNNPNRESNNSALSDVAKASLEKFKDRLADAVKNGDVDALRTLREEIKADAEERMGRKFKEEDDSDDEKGFDINDFKMM